MEGSDLPSALLTNQSVKKVLVGRLLESPGPECNAASIDLGHLLLGPFEREDLTGLFSADLCAG